MSDYNPNRPEILGNEWVPIQEPVIKLQRNVNNVEYGYGFTTTGSNTITEAQYYTLLERDTESTTWNQINIYPEGEEALSGPIRKTVIPVRSASITGRNYFATSNLSGTFCSVDATGSVVTDGDCTQILIDALNGFGTFDLAWSEHPTFPGNSTTPAYIAVSFMVNDYQTEIDNKRILNVSLIHRGSASGRAQGSSTQSANVVVPLQRFAGPTTALILAQAVNNPSGNSSEIIETFNGPTYADVFGPLGTGSLTLANDYVSPVTGVVDLSTNALNLGDVQRLWTYPAEAPETLMVPWTYDVLSQLDNLNANNRWIRFLINLPRFLDGGAVSGTAHVNLNYLALEVTYCEETRVGVGGSIVKHTSFTTTGTQDSVVHPIKIHEVGATYTNPPDPPTLSAGDYTITVSAVHPGAGLNLYAPLATEYPRLSATRPLTQLSTVRPVEVDIPFPVKDYTVVGTQFFSKPDFKPGVMLTMVASGAIIEQSHVFGQQFTAPVYQGFSPTELIVDLATGATTYPYLRYWARRMGDTTISLTASCSGSTAAITPDEFDALDRLSTDGWKEVTLAWSPPLVLTGPGTATITWSATSELAGSRWELLSSSAFTVSGAPASNSANLPSYLQTDPATYNGDNTDPQISVILSATMPAVTGLTATPLVQALTGIGLSCDDAAPCCIPSELFYTRLTWNLVTSDVFGYYELQRMDEVDTDWQTIMKATSISVSGFNDFEARTGMASSYRIRTVNIYEFASAWSPTVSGSVPAPGAGDSECISSGHLLLFTTNEEQDGSKNLAYSSVWLDNQVEESFAFPEADFVTMQAMYGRDFFVAFRPLERGGEQFQRDVLVQAAAIPPETLADFKSLRDLAWDDLNYVCVRDDDGNRWLAAVQVPSGNVLKNRKLYIAPVQITEVTETPTPVDPS